MRPASVAVGFLLRIKAVEDFIQRRVVRVERNFTRAQ